MRSQSLSVAYAKPHFPKCITTRPPMNVKTLNMEDAAPIQIYSNRLKSANKLVNQPNANSGNEMLINDYNIF